MEVSCAFPTALDSPDNIALAERLGYDRAWVYDTPQQSPDVWMTLALAAQRTERIGLGPGVLVPSLRHPMVNAAATATLCALAPDRVAVAFGTGFSGRRAMGYRAIPWVFMDSYIRVYRALLRGEVVEWEGAHMQMLHPDGHAPAHHRHLAVHTGHCVELNAADEASWHAGGSGTLRDVTLSGTRHQIRVTLDQYRSRSVTEVVFQTCGPDIQSELERFLDAARA